MDIKDSSISHGVEHRDQGEQWITNMMKKYRIVFLTSTLESFVYCDYDYYIFPPLGGGKPIL